jgi:hypothetical protein
MKLGYKGGKYFVDDFDDGDNQNREYFLIYDTSPYRLISCWADNGELSEDLTDNLSEDFTKGAIEEGSWVEI